jgi:hypothetical protein
VVNATQLRGRRDIKLREIRERYKELLWTDLGNAVEMMRLSLA